MDSSPASSRVRDDAIVTWVARMGAVSVSQLARRFGVGRAVSYALTKRLTDARLLERYETMPGDPSLIRATKKGIRHVGLGLKQPPIRLAEVGHWLTTVDVALALERTYGPERIRSETEIRFEEQLLQEPLASIELGYTRDYKPRRHTPDLAILGDEKNVAVEIELSAKSRRRLDEIMGAYVSASHLGSVLYLCEPGLVKRGVEAAVERGFAGGRVRVKELVRPAGGVANRAGGVGRDDGAAREQ
jgi:transposase